MSYGFPQFNRKITREHDIFTVRYRAKGLDYMELSVCN